MAFGGLGRSVGSMFGTFTDPITGNKAKASELAMIDKQLESLASDIRFRQALGGVSTSKPFKDIEELRALSKERLQSTSAFPLLLSSALFSNFGTSAIGGLFGKFFGGKK